MTNLDLYHDISIELNKNITKKYSSSFSRSILFLEPEIRQNIYNIYGFVRLADEIVDTFHDYPKKKMLDDFTAEYLQAKECGLSINPVIHAFCLTKNKYAIPDDLVDAFMKSMYMDLDEMTNLSKEQYKEYIYGSAEVVGLMCLYIFVKGDVKKFNEIKGTAKSFGAALQKVNFLRDINADFQELNRVYFPNVDFSNFTEKDKQIIEQDVAKDFKNALVGIKKLPLTSRFAVYLAYKYYIKLFKKIQQTKPDQLFNTRISVPKYQKSLMFLRVFVKQQISTS